VPDFKIDEVGNWTEIKLDIIRDYLPAYTGILSKQAGIRHFAFIDAFAGAGTHRSKETGEEIDGSPSIAIKTTPPFTSYHFIESDPARAEHLGLMAKDRADVTVYPGDANVVLPRDVFPQFRYEDYRRALCLLDPYDLNPKWDVVLAAGKSRSIEIFLNFMIMDANRNILLRNPAKMTWENAARMTAFWGDESWRDAAYETEPDLFEDQPIKVPNEGVAKAYAKRLREVAGFQFVPVPIPMRNSKSAAVYYLFFASPNKTGAKIVTDIMKKQRGRGPSHGS